MTKKFVYTDKDARIKGQFVKDEFLIPDIFNNTNYFIGGKTLKKYERGIIAYTGKSLTIDEVLALAKKNGSLGFFNELRVKKIIKKYLIQIKELKVGDNVAFISFNELKKVNRIKTRTFKDN